MNQDSRVAFLNRIDELGVMLFGERDGAAAESLLRTYKAQVYRSYEQDLPLVGPMYALTKVTNRCNSGCSYCNHSIYAKPQLDLADAPTESTKKVIREVAELGVRSVNFSGGEPLLRPDLPELISYAREWRLVPILLTNGLVLPERWEELGKVGPSYIILSLDSLDADLYHRQRGASFSRAWKGIEAALRLRDKYPPTAMHITTVVTKHNLAELPDLVQRMASYGVSVQFSPYHHFDTQSPDDNTPRDLTAVREVTNELLSLQQSGYPIANSRTYLAYFPSFFEQPHVLPSWYRCYAAYVGVFIDAQLNVRPCWSWSLPIVGNLGQENLRDVWHSASFNRQRARVRRLECSRCWLLCTAELSIRFAEQP